MSREKLTDNFYVDEFRCRCGCGLVCVSLALPRALEVFRSIIGDKNTYILSGSRCRSHNEAVGGADHSYHLCQNEDLQPRETKAADVYVSGVRPRQMFRAALKVPAFLHGGIGIYEGQGFVHLDVRGIKARWFVSHKGARPTSVPRNFY